MGEETLKLPHYRLLSPLSKFSRQRIRQNECGSKHFARSLPEELFSEYETRFRRLLSNFSGFRQPEEIEQHYTCRTVVHRSQKAPFLLTAHTDQKTVTVSACLRVLMDVGRLLQVVVAMTSKGYPVLITGGGAIWT
ncbi:hypothetical protein PoB_001616900 [Plakobranchus ocellatus]|uniref:Uncharacterized protein n=1 Tax=Plakobranchus ocellatus TaxID=259542 RepID=A0AAV3Z6P7_9GAST|nr:hypothetical protein PoB_001616900 [Plakobranchus ocellatus]